MKLRRAAIAVLGCVLAVGGASAALSTRYCEPASDRAGAGVPFRVVVTANGPSEPQESVLEPRWGRAPVTHDLEYWPSNRSDWTMNNDTSVG